MTGTLLLDNSAWAGLSDPALAEPRVTEIADAPEAGQIAPASRSCSKASYSAPNPREHDVLTELLSLPGTSSTRALAARARRPASARPRRHHRLPPVDLLIAALATHRGLGILHYDHVYDTFAAKTDLNFENDWLTPRGTF